MYTFFPWGIGPMTLVLKALCLPVTTGMNITQHDSNLYDKHCHEKTFSVKS